MLNRQDIKFKSRIHYTINSQNGSTHTPISVDDRDGKQKFFLKKM